MNQMSKYSFSSNTKKILLSAFLTGIAFPGNGLGLLSLIAYIPLLSVLYDSLENTKWRNFLIGTLFGAVYSTVAMYWVGLSTIGGFVGMTLTISIRYGLMTLLFGLLIKKKYYFYSIIFFLILQEYFCSVSELDYTWHLAGYSLTDFPILCQITEYTGIYGISFFIYSVNILLFLAYQNKEHYQLYLKLSISLIIIYGIINTGIYLSYSKTEMSAVKVGVLQPNIDPFVKWQKKYKAIAKKRLYKQAEVAIAKGADHIVFPETSVPYYLRYRSAKSIRDSLNQLSKSKNVTFSVGALDSQKRIPYNSVFHFLPHEEQMQVYYKQKLVPVAEKVIYPAVMAIFGNLLPGISGWGKGTETSVFKAENNVYHFSEESGSFRYINRDTVQFGTSICIESTFPTVFSEFKENGAQWINLITNDGWFYPHWSWFTDIANDYGFSPFFKGKGAYQHNKIAVVRAIENRVSIVRSANTGISSIIDPFGEIIEQTEQYEEDVIVNYVPILPYELTFFNRYGNWFIWLNGIGLLVMFLFSIKDRLTKNIIS